jgi:uncharacterized protein
VEVGGQAGPPTPPIAVGAAGPARGYIPLAAVLWNGGISFGGVLAFIFADLLVLPILNIYRKYYGRRMAAFLLVTFYAAIVASSLVVEVAFQLLGIAPTERNARVVNASVTWNYTTVLNIVFLALAAVLVWRFVRTGGLPMLQMMRRPMYDHEQAST